MEVPLYTWLLLSWSQCSSPFNSNSYVSGVSQSTYAGLPYIEMVFCTMSNANKTLISHATGICQEKKLKREPQAASPKILPKLFFSFFPVKRCCLPKFYRVLLLSQTWPELTPCTQIPQNYGFQLIFLVSTLAQKMALRCQWTDSCSSELPCCKKMEHQVFLFINHADSFLALHILLLALTELFILSLYDIILIFWSSEATESF